MLTIPEQYYNIFRKAHYSFKSFYFKNDLHMKRVMHVKDYLYGCGMTVASLKLVDILLIIIYNIYKSLYVIRYIIIQLTDKKRFFFY